MVEPFQGVVGAPELEPMIGKAFKLSHHTLKIEDTGGFRGLDLAQLKGTVLALDWVVGNRHRIWGSAVMVAPGVALTARHVVDSMREDGFLTEEGGYLLALGFHEHGMMLWNADSFTSVGAGDVAVLTLVRAAASPSLPRDTPIPVNAATIAARAPAEGK